MAERPPTARGEAGGDEATSRIAEDGPTDREPEKPQQDHDERSHEERVPPVGGNLVIEGLLGHGIGRGRRGQLKLRSTLGTAAASGSASKNSRRVKPSGPASRTDGNVAIPVL